MGAYHIIIQKQSGNIPFYDLLQKDDGLFTGFFRRNRHNTRQDAGDLHRSELQFSLFLAFGKQRPDIQGLVANQREGPGGIHRHGGQDRVNIIIKIGIHIGSLFFIQIFMLLHNSQSICLQQRQQRTIVCRILLGNQIMGHHIQLLQLLGGSQAGNILFDIFGIHHIL